MQWTIIRERSLGHGMDWCRRRPWVQLMCCPYTTTNKCGLQFRTEIAEGWRNLVEYQPEMIRDDEI